MDSIKTNDFIYSGTELQLFENAVNWKKYWSSHISQYVTGDVLDVGAGIGSTAKTLNLTQYKSWTCIEPDLSLCQEISKKINIGELNSAITVRSITTSELLKDELFDTILYIDVLEHIENDRIELEKAAQHLKKDGKIIILSPAHNYLFSEFDKKIGHHRRYNKKTLTSTIPNIMKIHRLFYLDSIGLLASLANKTLLHSSSPSHKQITFWDKVMIRLSRKIDSITGYNLGKSIICIIEKNN